MAQRSRPRRGSACSDRRLDIGASHSPTGVVPTAAAGAAIGAAWRDTLGRNFPPSTLLYIAGLVDPRAKVEIEVTAFVPAA